MDDVKQFIEKHIPNMNSPESVYELFKGLGYKILTVDYRGKEVWDLKEKDKEIVEEIFTVANYDKKFQIFLVKLKSFSSTIVRELPSYFEKEVQYPFFIFTPDYQNYTFVLIEKIRQDVGVFKRKLIKLNLDRENPFYTDKMVLSNMKIKDEVTSTSDILKILKEALSVEKVSNLFFEDYKKYFFNLRELLLSENINIKQAHEFSQQFLNRIMFIYFIDKKGWLKNSPKFMKWFWERYKEEKIKNNYKDCFYTGWLKVLFLEAFNNRFSYPEYLPKEIQETLAQAPYLNGGLFKKTELDNLQVNIPDQFVNEILQGLFEKYNFTIREDIPLDVEVAVDPQMIGYVYESLANIAQEIYERKDLGIFYTPKTEVDFMCKRSLLEYLFKTTSLKRETLYHLLFDEDKAKVEESLKIDDYERLEESLDNLSVLDPACGSGAFLVGMLSILADLYKFLYKFLRRDMTDYQLKKKIIGNSLYGVDVMPWAVHSAELRLWLSLMIESDISLSDLKLSPLLPNLNLKLRIGDSLVQEIGGINLNLRDPLTSQKLKKRLLELKREKEKYYNNDPTAKFKSAESVQEEELHIFYKIIDEKIVDLNKKKQILNAKKLEASQVKERELFIENINKEIKGRTEEEISREIDREISKIDEEINKLTVIKWKIKEQRPFIWDIDFVEIFGEIGGFDIVIGNPPYVRQENIAPPNKLRSDITNEEKKAYKEKLLKSVQIQFPAVSKIDKKSDYYIYFYFHGLSLLNKNGTFCFITSNSWLDTEYGKDLQEFLLKYVPIIAIYDNQSIRSFEHADVNTIIALFSSPAKHMKESVLDNLAKFVMFKKPYNDVINTDNLLKIEQAKELVSTEDFRVYPKKQEELLLEGWEYPDDIPEEQRERYQFLSGKYAGNNWGGKYLRAPDIFFTILEKGKGKLVRLGDIAEIRFGIKTGCNEFFYVIDVTDKIEEG